MHHKLDIHPIPEEMLYVNDPSLAVKVPYETEDEMEKAVTGKKKSEGGILPDDNVRIHVPMDLNADGIMRQRYALYGALGEPTESNEPLYYSGVRKIITQLEIYDQVWVARKVEENVQKENGGVSSVDVDKKNSFGFSVSIENMEQVKSDIMNVGIGTSQVLPVLISVLLSEPNEILVFEQPELHLHPYSQSRLADMFTEYCKHGRKIILETHSEYFLLRLRYHIVKEQYSQDATAVNFFQNKSGTKVTFANISGFGNIDYPEDFRDETQELLNSILEASFERKGLS